MSFFVNIALDGMMFQRDCLLLKQGELLETKPFFLGQIHYIKEIEKEEMFINTRRKYQRLE